jgi:hypothetical protein
VGEFVVGTDLFGRLIDKRSIIVFPALALAVSVGCGGAQQAQSRSLSTTLSSAEQSAPAATKVPGKSGSSNWPTALSVLAKIPVAKEHPQGYSRSLFVHWIDADADGCDTREEVLIAESSTSAQVDAFGCKVVEGDWFSPYEGSAFTSPGDLDIDHMVPLKEAWDSGAWNWSPAQRRAFANDLSDSRSLIAVTASQNRSKSDKDPSNWLPPRGSYVCEYLSNWVAIKAHWNLAMDQSEAGRIRNVLTRSCPDSRLAPWGTASAPSGGSSSGGQTKGSSPTTSVVPKNGVRQVRPVRCARADFGQRGQYRGVPYVCSNTRANGVPYAPGYYFWRPA